MPSFSKQSADRLATCDHRLQMIFNEVIQHIDCTIIEGHRSQASQDKYFAEGKSKLKWPNGEHNKTPSGAVDVAPYPIDWSNKPKALARFYFFAGYVKSVADSMGFKIRWGGDWDGDMDFTDQNFDDLPHFEIRD